MAEGTGTSQSGTSQAGAVSGCIGPPFYALYLVGIHGNIKLRTISQAENTELSIDLLLKNRNVGQF